MLHHYQALEAARRHCEAVTKKVERLKQQLTDTKRTLRDRVNDILQGTLANSQASVDCVDDILKEVAGQRAALQQRDAQLAACKSALQQQVQLAAAFEEEQRTLRCDAVSGSCGWGLSVC